MLDFAMSCRTVTSVGNSRGLNRGQWTGQIFGQANDGVGVREGTMYSLSAVN